MIESGCAKDRAEFWDVLADLNDKATMMTHHKPTAKIRHSGLILTCCVTFALIAMPEVRRLAAREDVPAGVTDREQPLLIVKIPLNREVYRPLEPIQVFVSIRNVGQQVVHLEKYINHYQDLDFEVDDVGHPVPRRVPPTSFHDRWVERVRAGSMRDNFALKPGETSRVSLTINLVADMTATTTYSVVAAVPYWLSADRDPERRRIIRSVPVRIEVKGEIGPPKS